jgi:Bacteriophage baseplate protein W
MTDPGSPLDIDFPYHVDARGRTATTGPADHVRDMIEQLLFVRPGERVNRPDFGCGLLDLVFEPNSPELAATLQVTAEGALRRWLGDVITVESLVVAAEESTLRVELRYVIDATGERRTDVFEGGVTP